MAKQLNVNLAFNADTNQAKKEILDLQKALTNVTSFSKNNAKLFDIASIKEAEKAAKELSQHLMKATDINTGKINLSTFAASLRNSGNNLSSYQKKLEAIGPVGERAFLQLSKSIANAESPLLRTNSKLKEFQTTLMNTARWQISSSILHGFMGALSSAYGYAQDLNQSLNNIRIVTGYNTDQMSKFAEQANKAAQALSTTTTRYTDAALIYYQQGLSDEEVLGRAETTIKLANVSRQSTEEVSDQLTAIWNNFYDGSQNLEYYADVITALGAATASSSEEISTGLEKFAAVSKTVGLSYEYATAALATITATTRQSADTVGTGLRTLFTRLEGLKLGETLEDGVDLNKYSAALQSVGVQVLDTSGNLREMDDILEDLGSKWGQLERSQKMALAQTVGGVRQYTNLIALMDNWDFMQENLATARGSEGTLQQQADIYAQSWEAAQKRVQAAAEEIYSSIFNDKFFISINDFFAKFLNGINGTIKGLGGLKGILLSIGSIFTQIYAKEAPLILDRIKESLLIISGQANQVALADQNKNLAGLNQEKNNALKNVNIDAGSVSYLADISGTEQLAQRKQELIRYQAEYNSLEKATAEQEIEDLKQANEQLLNKAKAYEEIENRLNSRAQLLNQRYEDRDVTTLAEFSKTAGILDIAKKAVFGFSIEIQSLQKELKGTANSTDEVSKKSQEYAQNLRNILNMASSVSSGQNANLLEGFSKGIEENVEKLKKGEIEVQEFLDRLEKIKERASNIMDKQSSEAQSDINANIRDATGKVIPELQNFSNAYRENAKSGGEVILTSGKVGNSISQLSPHLVTTSEILVSTTSGLMSFAGALRGVKSTLNTFSNKDSDAIDKIGAAIGLMTTSLMLFNNVGKMSRTIIAGYTTAQKTAEIATNGLLTATQKQTVAQAAQNAVAAANPYILGATAAITAVTAVIGLLTWHTQQLTEAQEEEAQQARERADQINQEAEENEKLISSMDDLLNRYKDGEDVKKELDSITNTLADAYDIEGAAVARLTGRYEDYEVALNNAKQKKLEMLNEQIADNKEAMDKSGVALLSAAKGGIFDSKQVSADNTYSFSIESSLSANTDTADKKAMEILRNNIKSANIQNSQKSSGSGASTGEITTFSIDNINQNLNQLVALYHEIEKARSEIVNGPDGIGEEAASNSKVYNDLGKYLDSIKSYIDEYEKYSQNYESLLQKRNNPIDQIKSYEDYKKWVNEITATFKEAKYDDDFISGFISNEYKNATKEVKKFADAYQASQDIIKKSNVSEENIAKAFGAEEGYDANIAALMNWSMLSDETWESAYQGAKKYYDAIQQNTQATEDLANAQNALSDFGTKLTKSSAKKLAKDLEWGKTDENGNEIIMQYSDFLLLSSEKQLSYLKNLEKEAAISAKETLQEQIEFEKSVLQEYYDWRNSEQAKQDAQARDAAQKIINDIQLIRAAFAKDSDINNWSDDDRNLLNQYGNGATNLSAFNNNVSETEESAQNTIFTYDNKITAIQNYENNIASLNQSEQEASLAESLMYESLSELNQAFSTNSISESDYRTALVTMAAEYGNCEAEINNYKQALEEHNTVAIEAAKEELELAIAAGEVGKKYNLSTDELEAMGKVIKLSGKAIDGLSDDVKKNGKECIELAKDITRFDKAVESVTKNVKNWNKALSGDNLQDQATAIAEMSSAYGDLLDLDGSQLSADFLTNADNLKLMEDAINGVDGAYESLLEKANEDLTAGIKESLSGDALLGFEAGLNSIDVLLQAAGFDAMQAGEDINAALNNLEDPHISNDRFLEALAEMVNAAGMTADQATHYLSSMGIDAEVVNEPEAVEEQVGTKVIPKPATRETFNPGTPIEFTATGVDYDTEPVYATKIVTGTGLKVVSANKSSGGNIKHSNSTLASGNGRSSGGKGGGGGGSSKAYTPRKRKTDDAEKERYVEINAQLKTTSQLLNTINTAKDRAYGGARVKHIDEEISALNREYGQLQQLIKEDEEWLEKDKGKIAEYGLKTGWDNNINNYDEIFDAEKAKLIAAYDLFDQKMQSAIDEAEKKELEKEIEEAEERFGKFQEVVNQYHTTLQKLEDDNQTATENRNKVYDDELEKITHMIDVWDDYYDRELKYLDFLLNQIGDGADRALDRMDNYTEKMGRTFDKIDNFQEGIEETLDHMGLSLSDLEGGFNRVFDGDNWTKDIDALKNYQDSLISLGNELLELRRTLLEEVSAAFDEFNSDLDRAVDGVDHLRRFTETYKNILDIVGKDVIDPTGRTTNMLARTAFTQAQANANALQTQLDMQLSAIDDYNRTIANLQSDNRYGEHDDTIKEFKNQLKEAEDAYAATQEEWLGAWEETVQAAADIYETTMLQIIEDFGKSVSGLAGSLEELDTRFNRAKSLADTYVDDYEKIYQLSKLNRDINNSIDDTDNIRSKQRLRDLQEQINDLQASDNQMSEYEIENLRRRYELELVYLQLEEARDVKSQVRMVRDNEGNWGYIYTADETAVEEAEQNYEDKLYAMQKANTEYIESLESEILQLEQEWSDALAGIRVQDYASYEEYQEAIDRTNDYYTQKLDQTYEQMGIAIDNNKVLYDEDWAAYSAATGYKISEDERFIDDFKETTLSLTTGYQTIEDAQNAFRDATLNVTNDMVQAFQDWERDTNTSLELGGTNIQNYAEDVNEAINGDGGIVDQTEDAVEAVETMSDEYQDAFTEIIDYAGTFCSQFDDIIDDIVDDCNRAVEAIQNLLEAMGEEVERNDPNDYTWKNLKEGTGEYEWVYENSAGKRKTGNFRASYTAENGESYIADFFADASGILQGSKENSEHNGLYGASNIEWIKKVIEEAAHGDTGMYTGNWGSPEGRLAVLHEKELVLNKDDTSNFLSAIGMIRDISHMIDLNSITSSNLMASMFGIRGVSTGTDTLEQEVNIHAEFPNVQNHSEIEEAFDNLINKASQYANRKI